jgi:ceramide glucosyltransferase
LLAGLALLSLALTLWQWLVALRFPLHRRGPRGSFAPPVSLLKPLKGCEAETAACLESWFRQDYPGPVQILFGVASADDPVCEAVRRLRSAHPSAHAELVICAASFGPNAKVSTLVQLERKARHEILVISDADVRVPPDLLAQVVQPLQDASVGLVNCFYRFANPANFAMRWEAFAVNADFWSQVLMSQSLKPLDFALGAVMAAPRARLAALGGFAALADYLADDYQLGHRIAQAPARIVLAPVVVECWNAPMTWREVWAHQLRWARTIRACEPWPYFFSILSNATLWPLLWLAIQPTAPVLSVAACCLGVRLATALHLQQKLRQRLALDALWLAPLKDLLQALVWLLAFLSHSVVWRGVKFRIDPGGKLHPH